MPFYFVTVNVTPFFQDEQKFVKTSYYDSLLSSLELGVSLGYRRTLVIFVFFLDESLPSISSTKEILLCVPALRPLRRCILMS